MTRLGTVHIGGFPFYVDTPDSDRPERSDPRPPHVAGPTPARAGAAPQTAERRGVRSA